MSARPGEPLNAQMAQLEGVSKIVYEKLKADIQEGIASADKLLATLQAKQEASYSVSVLILVLVLQSAQMRASEDIKRFGLQQST